MPQNEAKSTPNRDHASNEVLLAQQRSSTSDSSRAPLVLLVLEYVDFSQTSHGMVLLVESVREIPSKKSIQETRHLHRRGNEFQNGSIVYSVWK